MKVFLRINIYKHLLIIHIILADKLYFINNVQGKGEYLTDPSIYTILGNLDLTDKWKGRCKKKKLWKEELKLVDIFMN